MSACYDNARWIARVCCITGAIEANGLRSEFIGTEGTRPLDARDQVPAGGMFNLASFDLVGMHTVIRGAA